MITSHIEDLPDETAENLLQFYNIDHDNRHVILQALDKRKTSHGFFRISLIVGRTDMPYENVTVSVTTSDMQMIDASNEDGDWFEDCDAYDNNQQVISDAMTLILKSEYNQLIINEYLS